MRKMTGVERFDLDTGADLVHLRGHRLEDRGRVRHDVVALAEVHGAAVERADFGLELANMLDTLGRPSHVGAVRVWR